MVERGDIVWADLGPPAGRRPVCVLTRDVAIAVLTAITCAPITRTVRGIRSEVELGPAQGLPNQGVVSCDNLITIPVRLLDSEPVGHLDLNSRIRLDQALRYALDTQYSTLIPGDLGNAVCQLGTANTGRLALRVMAR